MQTPPNRLIHVAIFSRVRNRTGLVEPPSGPPRMAGVEPATSALRGSALPTELHCRPRFRCRSRNARVTDAHAGAAGSRPGLTPKRKRPGDLRLRGGRKPRKIGLLTLETPTQDGRNPWACRLQSWRGATALRCRNSSPRRAQRARDTTASFRRVRIEGRVVSPARSRGKLRASLDPLPPSAQRAHGRRWGNMPTQQRRRQRKYFGFLDENRSQVCLLL